ncbi:uncharacterized protein LOC130444916 [Diorhabda sublineata]|uniref:uncharacterized protein LOC130444916 n=1 Tax=Diorhabda sublineata TaxID=1163346 RepID=UPI0024E13138|nr:uncharacterized protein LOC130444916 [Diorhabda sublineata]
MTSRNVFLPTETINKLKCDLCRGYLSVPPIYSCKDKYACGRCNPEWERNVIYEELAQYMIFPCVFCEVGYPWGAVQYHEEKCRKYRLICPPINSKRGPNRGQYHQKCWKQNVRCPFDLCLDNIDVNDILKHFDKHHPDYVFADTVRARKIFKEEKVWNFNPETNVCLLVSNNIPLLLFIHNECHFDETTGDILHYNYYFALFTFCTEKFDLKYSVNVELYSRGALDYSKTLKNQDIKRFNGKIHCASFFRQDLFKLNSFDFATTKFAKLERKDGLVLTYSVNVTDGAVQMSPEKRSDQSKGIEKYIECPICKEYMCAPIYNCSAGHTICKRCRNKLSLCPYCQAVLGNSRNYVLEDISETVTLKCHNEHKGCVFTSKVREIKLHEVSCTFN